MLATSAALLIYFQSHRHEQNIYFLPPCKLRMNYPKECLQELGKSMDPLARHEQKKQRQRIWHSGHSDEISCTFLLLYFDLFIKEISLKLGCKESSLISQSHIMIVVLQSSILHCPFYLQIKLVGTKYILNKPQFTSLILSTCYQYVLSRDPQLRRIHPEIILLLGQCDVEAKQRFINNS